MLKTNKHLSFSSPDTAVPSGTEVTLTERSPVAGKVNSILLHFPAGCNALVQISCFIGSEQVLSLTGFIALDDATEKFPLGQKVDKNALLTVVIANTDSVNPHTPSIIWDVETVGEGS